MLPQKTNLQKKYSSEKKIQNYFPKLCLKIPPQNNYPKIIKFQTYSLKHSQATSENCSPKITAKSYSPKLGSKIYSPKGLPIQSCCSKLLRSPKAVPQTCSTKLFYSPKPFPKLVIESCSGQLLSLPPKLVSESGFPKLLSKAIPQSCHSSTQLFVNATAKPQSCSPQLLPKAALQSDYRKPHPKEARQNSKAAARSWPKAGPESCPKLLPKH